MMAASASAKLLVKLVECVETKLERRVLTFLRPEVKQLDTRVFAIRGSSVRVIAS